ncbi:MAG TPA: hypothetical protein VIL51_03730 [Thermoleophilia bacterium]
MAARMSLILVPIIVTIFAVVVIVGAVRRNRAIVFDADRYPGLVALRRSTVTARYVGLAASVMVFVAVASLGQLGRGLFLAPAAAGAVLVLAVIIGQQLAYGGARKTGVAGVERRRVRDYLPRDLTVAVLLFLVILIASAAWTTSAASPDSLGLYRAFAVTGTETVLTKTGPEVVTVGSTRSPFPGAFYTSMLPIGLPIVLALGVIGLWLTARRPRNGADPQLVPADDALRRQTAEGIVAAVGLAVCVSLLGVALGAAGAVGGMAEHGVRYILAAGALGLVALGSLAVASWCAVLILVPGGGTVKPS